MQQAHLCNRQYGFRHCAPHLSTCLIILLLLPACAGKNRVADLYTDKLAKLEAVHTEPNTEKSLENLAPEKLIQEGNRYLASGNQGIAKLHFAMALKKKPFSVEACFGLGRVFLLEGEMQKAHEVFSQALLVDPGHKFSLLAVAKISRGKNKFDASFSYLNKAMALYPDDPEILTELAITYDAAGREYEAEPLYLKVVGLLPQQASAYNNVGFNYLLQKKYVPAITAFNQAGQLEYNTNQRTLNNLAMAYIYIGEDEKAVNLLKQTVGEAGAYNNLGYIYMLQGKCDPAKKAFQQALDLNPLYYVRANRNLERLSRCDNAFPSDLTSTVTSGAGASSFAVINVLPPGKSDFPGLSEPSHPDAAPEVHRIPTMVEPSQDKNSVETGLVGDREIRTVGISSGTLRDAPSLEASALGYLRRGERVTELKQNKDWCFVRRRDGSLGWVHKSLFASIRSDASLENNLAQHAGAGENESRTRDNASINASNASGFSGLPGPQEVSGQDSNVQPIAGGEL